MGILVGDRKFLIRTLKSQSKTAYLLKEFSHWLLLKISQLIESEWLNQEEEISTGIAETSTRKREHRPERKHRPESENIVPNAETSSRTRLQRKKRPR
ncbi:hypothetical protein [Lentibacillus sp. Marseille-P4043]|uniref:hypothetical protein n=1 Tax=Lentibacillus sp. Marseille-P4043 TaxID=2040293 RepID=UPI000D0B743A|nr:hypothetical protein [Lentibacillus sp. Marseille-P4043]